MQDDKNAIFQMRFPQKLWYLLNMRTDAILWGGTGRTILLNYRILHNYLQCDHSIFKTTNISSFVRQLNLYGFRKVTSHLQDPLCNSCNPYMHEYVHDYFQIGRPELLNKITRKALAMRKNFKPKQTLYSNVEQLVYLTPLQKARRSLHEALQKAAHDMFLRSNPIQFYECDEHQDFCDSEENIELDWLLPKKIKKKSDSLSPPATSTTTETNCVPYAKESEDFEDCEGSLKKENTLMSFNEDPSPQSNDFPSQFLSMPDLDAGPNERNPVELLAEFNIDHDQHDSMGRDITVKEHEHVSLNCVLPSIGNDPNDDVTMTEKDNDTLNHYNGEWDQMFSDIMTNKGNNQDYSSDLKELYSQISRTIDLLND